ncbi:MAG: hypothetical protein QW154_07470 [Sulfolobales archaeon]
MLPLVKLVGTNAGGHAGWATKRCKVCSRDLVIGEASVYYCSNCSTKYGAYFCSSDARVLHYKCPYCKQPLELLL